MLKNGLSYLSEVWLDNEEENISLFLQSMDFIKNVEVFLADNVNDILALKMYVEKRALLCVRAISSQESIKKEEG